MGKKNLLIVGLVALIAAFVFNEVNRESIRLSNPQNKRQNTKSLVHDATVWSVDNAWYLPQIEHMLAGEGYTINPDEPGMTVRRTPGYPLFYGFFYFLFGEETCHVILPYIQLLLFALSAALLSISVFNIFGSKAWAMLSGLSFGALPFASSYCYFTLTEGLFPALVVFEIFAFSCYLKSGKQSFLLLSGVLGCITFLTRPLAGVIIIGICSYLLFRDGLRHALGAKLKQISLFVLGFVLMLSPWVIRNYMVTGELILAEKVYDGAPMDFGRSHLALRSLIACWTNPANMSTEVFSSSLRRNIDKDNIAANQQVIDAFIDRWPREAFQGFDEGRLKEAIGMLEAHFIARAAFLNAHPDAKRSEYMNLVTEDLAFHNLSSLQTKFVETAPLRYYVITPLTSTKELIFNSFLHHINFINPLKGSLNWWQLVLKTLAFVFNVLLYLSVLYFIVFFKLERYKTVLVLFPVIFLFIALTIGVRYIENRYLLPIYPLMYVSFGFMFLDITSKVKHILRHWKTAS